MAATKEKVSNNQPQHQKTCTNVRQHGRLGIGGRSTPAAGGGSISTPPPFTAHSATDIALHHPSANDCTVSRGKQSPCFVPKLRRPSTTKDQATYIDGTRSMHHSTAAGSTSQSIVSSVRPALQPTNHPTNRAVAHLADIHKVQQFPQQAVFPVQTPQRHGPAEGADSTTCGAAGQPSINLGLWWWL